MKKSAILPVLVAPVVAVLVGMIIVGSVAGYCYFTRPLELNTAGLLLLMLVIPTVGYAVAFVSTVCVNVPIRRFALRRGYSVLKMLFFAAMFLSVLGILCMLLLRAPKGMAFVYGVGLFLPCSVAGAFTFAFLSNQMHTRHQSKRDSSITE